MAPKGKTNFHPLIAMALMILSGESQSGAAEFSVISVARNLPLSKDEVAIKDFYINAGSNNGLKSGATIEAMRKLIINDNTQSKALGNTSVPIAQLRLIHVDKNVSIARLVRFFDKKDTPQGQFEDVMIGDLIRVAEQK